MSEIIECIIFVCTAFRWKEQEMYVNFLEEKSKSLASRGRLISVVELVVKSPESQNKKWSAWL